MDEMNRDSLQQVTLCPRAQLYLMISVSSMSRCCGTWERISSYTGLKAKGGPMGEEPHLAAGEGRWGGGVGGAWIYNLYLLAFKRSLAIHFGVMIAIGRQPQQPSPL